MAGSNAAIDLSFFDKPKNEGRIARKTGSKKLYFDFFYHGVRIEKSTGLDDTPKNRYEAEQMLAAILEMKKLGTLEFAKIFPKASEEEKAFHAKLEQREYAPDARGITFAGYVAEWYKEIWPTYESHTKQQDYKSAIDYWLLPHFGKMSFHSITAYEMEKFVDTLRHKKGPLAGQKLSRKRIVNILQVFNTLWKSARKKHGWKLDDPFEDKEDYLPKKKKKYFVVLRFAEWEAILEAMDPYYRPVTKLMMLTGLIASEIAALKKSHIRDGYLYIEQAVVRKVEKDEPKNEYRRRRYKITKAIAEVLEEAEAASTGIYLFRMDTGQPFTAERFQRQVWRRALEKAGVTYRKPYITRHSFAAWALAIRIDKNRLVSHMGHASKQMVYETYGHYVEGLEKDRLKILAFFGRDFKRG